MSRRFYVLLALALLFVWAGVAVYRHSSQIGPDVGSQAPIFNLEDTNGARISLESLKGKVVLLNFWASWCGPCRQEMPSLEALYQKFKDREFVVLGLSVDEGGWGPVKSFLQEFPVSFPVLLDADQKATELYEIVRVPETYLINPQGKIVGKIVGPQDYNQPLFYNKIEKLLSQR